MECHYGPTDVATYKAQYYICFYFMMTSSNGNIFRVTGHLCGEFKFYSLVNSPHKGQWRGALMFALICARINGWVNNGGAGDLRRHRAHYDVILMCNSCRAEFIKLNIKSYSDFLKLLLTTGRQQEGYIFALGRKGKCLSFIVYIMAAYVLAIGSYTRSALIS